MILKTIRNIGRSIIVLWSSCLLILIITGISKFHKIIKKIMPIWLFDILKLIMFIGIWISVTGICVFFGFH